VTNVSWHAVRFATHIVS